MRLHQWNIAALIATGLAILTVTAYSSNATADTSYDVSEEYKVNVFSAGECGYDTYRIPTIVQGNDDRLYAFVEGRKYNGADYGDIDLVMKTSDDGGRTWSSMSVIRDAGPSTAGNPSPVVDAATGRMNLLYCVDVNTMYSTYSDDGGATWAADSLIDTSGLGLDGARVYTGPVHGIQLTRGENAGRLVVSGSYRSSKELDSNYGACTVYSDDGGSTWQVGATDTHAAIEGIRPLEHVAVELTDGQIYFNARNHFYDEELGDNDTRAIAFSSDGGETFDAPFAPYSAINTPVVQNSLIRFKATDQGDSKDVLVYSAPYGTDVVREDMTLYLSFDEAESWTDGILIHSGMAGYSDLVKMDSAHVGLLFESGNYVGDYGRIDFSCVAVNVPEPSTLALTIIGMIALAATAYRKRRRK